MEKIQDAIQEILKRELSDHLDDFYNFAYALVPDDLMAQQILADAFLALCLDDVFKRSVYQLNDVPEVERKARLNDLVLNTYKKIYQLGRKRFTQIKKLYEFA